MYSQMLASSVYKLFKYFNLAGVLKNKFSIEISVPRLASAFSHDITSPPFIIILVPTSPVDVFSVTLDTAAIEGSASPLKPKDDILNKPTSS